jgi:excisionase family DNA binding protein
VPDADPLLTTAQVAARLGISRRTLAKWWADGKVRPAEITIGGHGRWREADLRKQITDWRLRLDDS